MTRFDQWDRYVRLTEGKELSEAEYDGQAMGGPKHWHLCEVIASSAGI
jgi:hypothetical protein